MTSLNDLLFFLSGTFFFIIAIKRLVHSSSPDPYWEKILYSVGECTIGLLLCSIPLRVEEEVTLLHLSITDATKASEPVIAPPKETSVPCVTLTSSDLVSLMANFMQPSETETPTPPEPIKDKPVARTAGWTSSLPKEPVGGFPVCTNFTLLHRASGGPSPGGCYAVGCAEGYALPMAMNDGAWKTCTSSLRLKRKEDHYRVTDADGTTHTAVFKNGVWSLEK